MKVLILSMWYPNSENPIFGTFIHEQAMALKNCGVDVRVLQPIPLTPFPIKYFSKRYYQLSKIKKKETYDGIKVFHSRFLTFPKHILYEYTGRWMYKGMKDIISHIYNEWQFDIIHAHATYPCGWSANCIRDNCLRKIKTVHTIHRVSIIDIPNFNKKCFELVKESLLLSDWNVFVSKEGYNLATLYTNNRICNKSSYITNGVNFSRFNITQDDEIEIKKLKKTYSDSINILFIGYLIERKGIKELLNAYVKLGQFGVRRKTRLFLIGRNMLGSYVRDFIKSHNIEKQVIMPGPVLHDHIKRWLRFADIFILPSRSEGLATVLFESLYMSKPAIFTNVGGTCDIVKNGKHAILINPQSETEIAKALADLINNPDLREKLAKNGHRLIKENYSWEINAKKNLEIYQRII